MSLIMMLLIIISAHLDVTQNTLIIKQRMRYTLSSHRIFTMDYQYGDSSNFLIGL